MIQMDLLMAASFLVALAMLAGSMLVMWQGWLQLKMRELDMQLGSGKQPREVEGGSREGAARIEIADLKERIRKLEAIANGVDL